MTKNPYDEWAQDIRSFKNGGTWSDEQLILLDKLIDFLDNPPASDEEVKYREKVSELEEALDDIGRIVRNT